MSRWWSSVILGAVLGCTSPTLPLPPPSPPGESAGAPGSKTVILTAGPGSVEPNSDVVVFNTDTSFPANQRGAATIANPDGSWTLTVFAVKNDVLQIIELVGNTESSIDFTVLVN